jgi:hypothetical protein
MISGYVTYGRRVGFETVRFPLIKIVRFTSIMDDP